MRLTLLLVALSCLLAATSACIWWTLSFPGEPLPKKRVAVMALLQLWPVIPVVALMWRWSRPRLVATLLLWCGATFIVFLWRQIELRPFLALAAMANEIGLPLVLVSLVFMGSATRAVAPWLLLPAAVLMWSSLLGLEVLVSMDRLQSPTLFFLVGWFEAFLGWHTLYAVPALFAPAVMALAWWPAWSTGAHAEPGLRAQAGVGPARGVYRRMGPDAVDKAVVTVPPQAGIAGGGDVVPLLILPAIWFARRQRRIGSVHRRSTVPRSFSRRTDARSVRPYRRAMASERQYRLIAGTDLAITLDADDIFRFLEGELAERYRQSR